MAFDVLMAVEGGAFASDELRVRGTRLGNADAGLATEIAMGVLRRRGELDAAIDSVAGRPVARMDREVAAALRMGAYQALFLDRVPRYAAVSESVSLVRRSKKASAAGFVNAVLRRVRVLDRGGPGAVNLPPWLWRKWREGHGEQRALAIAASALRPPGVWIRVPPGAETEAESLGAAPTETPGCWRAAGETGPFRIQDIGSQAIVPLLEVESGMRVLDVAAAPGNKSAQILEMPGVRLVACDASRSRLSQMRLNAARVLADGAKGLPFGPVFDRVLLDAPCSGTGTIGRNPEIKWRVQPEDLVRHAARQRAMLRNALGLLKPGGRLVYSTCSLEPEENEDVVAAALEGLGDVYELERMERRIPGEDEGDGFFAAMLASRLR
ncbi:MAG: transcription antitermination factor NusB [Bryobacteraceae bacterium]